VQIVQLLTVSGNMQRLPISHNMTTGTGMLLSLAGTAAASWPHVLQSAAHFRLELLPLEMPGRQEWNIALMALATSWCRWNADDGVLVLFVVSKVIMTQLYSCFNAVHLASENVQLIRCPLSLIPLSIVAGCAQLEPRNALIERKPLLGSHFYQRISIVSYANHCYSQRRNVRPSVRLSVTPRYCIKTKKASIMISSPSESLNILVSRNIWFITKFERGHPE